MITPASVPPPSHPGLITSTHSRSNPLWWRNLHRHFHPGQGRRSRWITGFGTVQVTPAAMTVLTMPAPGGTVQDVLVRAQQTVAAQRPVIVLRSEQLAARLTQAQAQLRHCEVQLATQRQQLAQHQAALRAIDTQVAPTTAGHPQRRSLKQALQTALANYAAQEARCSAQALEVERLKQRLDDLELLHLPVAGTVVTSQLELDALPGRDLIAGQPLLTVMNPAELAVELWVSQTKRALIAPGMMAEFRPQGTQGQSYPAVVQAIAAPTEVPPTTQSSMVRVTLQLQTGLQTPPLPVTGTVRIYADPLPFRHRVTHALAKVALWPKLFAS